MSDSFDWAANPDIAVREQPALAVYEGLYGQVIIRKERAWDEEDDTFVPIAKENLLAIVRALLVAGGLEDAKLYRVTGESEYFGSCEDIEWPAGPLSAREVAMVNARPDLDMQEALRDFAESEAEESRPQPKDRTAAERQRRHRANKKRDTERDTDRDTVTELPLAPIAANGHHVSEEVLHAAK